MNPPIASHKTPIRPLAQGLREAVEPNGPSQARLEQAKHQLDPNVLFAKLDKLKREEEKKEMVNLKFNRHLTEKLGELEEDDGQAILDEHVSRVFSPNNNLSPGTISPRHLNRHQHRSNQMTTSMPEFGKTWKKGHSWFCTVFTSIVLFSNSIIDATFEIHGACIDCNAQYNEEVAFA